MKIIPTDTCVDIELFQDDLKDIDPEFIPSIISIYRITSYDSDMGFLFITKNNVIIVNCINQENRIENHFQLIPGGDEPKKTQRS